jgi:hypothetical protein
MAEYYLSWYEKLEPEPENYQLHVYDWDVGDFVPTGVEGHYDDCMSNIGDIPVQWYAIKDQHGCFVYDNGPKEEDSDSTK